MRNQSHLLVLLLASPAWAVEADLFAALVPGGGAEASSALELVPPSTSSLGSFDIIINPGAGLAANPGALAAFERAAATWESFIADPIVVNIDANLEDLMSPDVIGQANSVRLRDNYDFVRNLMVVDAANEADDAIVAALPTLAEFSFFAPVGNTYGGMLDFNKAAGKAMGYSGLDQEFGTNDATITFNTGFAFDYDNSDGVGGGLFDFESVALHEIGHALGFVSEVDFVDFLEDGGATGELTPRVVDLFRFAEGTEFDPETLAEFTSMPRNLLSGVDASFDDLSMEVAYSTGRLTGDGRQASHWKDDDLVGILTGAMDPTLAPGQVFELSAADLRALDVIGYEIVPEPSVGLLGLLAMGLAFRRRR